MDFLERIFGLAPDGGSGFTEAAILICLAAAFGLSAFIRRRARHGRGS